MTRSRLLWMVVPLGVVALFALAGQAWAATFQHNNPKKADKQIISFVVAYTPCTAPPGGITDPASGTSACPAVRTNTSYKFGPKGATVSKTKVVKDGKAIKPKKGLDFIPLSGVGSAGPDMEITTTGKDVWLDTGSLVTGEMNGSVFTRITDQRCANPNTPPPTELSCTIGFDLPFLIGKRTGASATTCNSGVCFQQTTGNLIVQNLFPGPPAIIAGANSALEVGPACISPVAPLPNPGATTACQGILVGKPPRGGNPAGLFTPQKAKLLKLPLVRDYQQIACSAPRTGLVHATPLSFPACSPGSASSPLKFEIKTTARGDKSKGLAFLLLKAKASKKTGNSVSVLVKVNKVQDAAGNPFTGTLALKGNLRITHAACDDGVSTTVPCTLPDIAVSVPVPCNAKGNCIAKTTLGLSLPSSAPINIEVGTVRIDPGSDLCVYDPSNKPFACPGLLLP